MLVNVKKCTFMKPKLVYLGFVISRDGLNMDPEKVQAILDWPSLTNIFEVRRFLGLASFSRKFINNFSGIFASIVETIRKDRQPFQWTAEAERSFQFLKKNITEQPVLKLPDFKHPFQVKCDASGVTIGVVLGQEDMRIVHFSEKVNDEKRNYSSYDKGFYAIFQAMKHWRHYLIPREFVLYFDNHAFQYIMRQPKLNLKHVKLVEFL